MRDTQPAAKAKRLMIALDVDELADARAIADDLKGLGVTFKIGNQLGTYEGWRAAIKFAREYGAQIFCDTKFKDIPATVEKSCRAMTRHEPDFFNIMADTTLETMLAAFKGVESAVADYGVKRPKLLGVTVLTSINDDQCQSVYGGSVEQKVMQFARDAATAGLDGLVCSPREAAMIKAEPSLEHLQLITPGVRPEWAAAGDQSRIVTPAEAVKNGSDYLVIGRPITQPPEAVGSPRKAVEMILKEIGG